MARPRTARALPSSSRKPQIRLGAVGELSLYGCTGGRKGFCTGQTRHPEDPSQTLASAFSLKCPHSYLFPPTPQVLRVSAEESAGFAT